MINKLGKLPKKTNSRTLMFSKYAANLPAIWPAVDWSHYVTAGWPMDGNDQYGDCTCAAIAKKVQLDTTIAGSPVVPTLDQVLSVYSAVTGIEGAAFSAGPPVVNDNGCAITDVLAYFQSNGIAGQKISGWTEIDHTNHDHVKLGIDLFGGIDIGFNVPAFINENPGSTWDVDPSGDQTIEGGHSVWAIDYDAATITVVSWGALYFMTYAFWDAFVDEAYAVISPVWSTARHGSESPSNFDLVQLQSDLQLLHA